MKICCTSDLHSSLPTVPDCDLLLIAGDICGHREFNYQHRFLGHFSQWVRELEKKGTDVVWVAGNHDTLIAQHPSVTMSIGGHYLHNSSCKVGSLKIFGTPDSLPFGWCQAFMKDEAGIWDDLLQCPEGTDIIISHGPPYGVADFALRERGRPDCGMVYCGSHALRNKIEAIKPRYAVVGHLHRNYGIHQLGETTVVSCSLLDDDYNCRDTVIEIEL